MHISAINTTLIAYSKNVKPMNSNQMNFTGDENPKSVVIIPAKFLAVLLPAMLGLSSCNLNNGKIQEVNPVTRYEEIEDDMDSATKNNSIYITEGANSYTVQPGNHLIAIARAAGLTIQELLNMNPDIDDPSKINVGQIIYLQAHNTNSAKTKTHVLKSGETLYSVAKANDCTLDELIKINHITDVTNIPENTVLKLPNKSVNGNKSEKAKTYVLKPGDTLYSVAKANGCTLKELMEINHITDENKVCAGTKLIIPTL